MQEFNLQIAPEFESLLRGDVRLFGQSMATLRDFEDWFNLSGTPFFREYTDHSFRHSLDVFETACETIGPDAVPILSSEDINVLLLSCVVHDSGMHITDDIFIALTDSANKSIAHPDFDQETWPELWADFLGEARRFNSKRLISLFGSAEPIREPPRSSLDLTQRDRLLIGEFLRRHHPRLAHEISLGQVPDARGKLIGITERLASPLRDIVGLVGRSHGMPLRSLFNHITNNYHLRDFNRIHLVFIMILLRIADFLQIQPARAPEFFGKIHFIRSPYSKNEWRVHQCIRNITTSSLDPEAIYVSAEPPSIQEFLRLENWLTSLQAELDISWAVMGEVYGRFTQEKLNLLKLNIRRVRSDIEDRGTLEAQITYVPERIRFTVAEAELLNLLLSPLYGDNPLYGLRELTQNAADSVQELDHLLHRGMIIPHDRLSLSGDIEVELSNEGATQQSITVRDRGTGMTLDVLRNYFLRAGASFRSSERWKRDFADEHGRSRIARSGRFGVGVLSAFLIGERITVYTKHFSEKSEYGYFFECSIHDDEIEIKRRRGAIGTEIAVLSDQDRVSQIRKYLASRRILERGLYYCLEKPSLSILNVPESQEVRRDLSFKASVSDRWIGVLGTEYEDVRWNRRISDMRSYGYTYGIPPLDGHLYCNGIHIGAFGDTQSVHSAASLVRSQIGNGVLSIAAPNVLITDNDGRLPLNLARTGLTRDDKQLSDALVASILEEFTAAIFGLPAESPAELLSAMEKQRAVVSAPDWSTLAFSKSGFMPVDPALLREAQFKRIIISNAVQDQVHLVTKDDLYQDALLLIRRERFSFGNKEYALRLLRRDLFYAQFNTRAGNDLDGGIRCLVVPDPEMMDVMTHSKVAKYIQKIWDARISVKVFGKHYALIPSTASPKAKNLLDSVEKFLDRLVEPLTVGTFVALEDSSFLRNNMTFLSNVWRSCFDSAVLPYPVAQRQSVLKKNAPIRKYLK
jgi:molecular chaperone HtpG